MENKTIKDIAIELTVETTFICDNIKGRSVYTNQLLRSCSSIGANAHEAKYAQSKADFINKLSIALKEANETLYWLELFLESEIITRDEYDSLFQDLDELIALLTSTIKTSKK